jgi:chemotaxis protein MotB
LMQVSGIRADQVTQVRGFADQRLRKIDAPLDPINRRVSLIVQYLVKPPSDGDDAKPAAGGAEGKTSEGKSSEVKPGEPAPTAGPTPAAPAADASKPKPPAKSD